MTQRERILDYIDTFGSITSMEAFSDLGITKLTTRISEIRQSGVPIQSVKEKRKNRYGEDTTYYRYSRPVDMNAINELCLKCGKYELEHEGACYGCKWLSYKYGD